LTRANERGCPADRRRRAQIESRREDEVVTQLHLGEKQPMLAARLFAFPSGEERRKRSQPLPESLDAEKQVVVEHTEMANTPTMGKTTARTSAVLNLGPDHFVRLTAVKRLIELLVAGRALPAYEVPEKSAEQSRERMDRWAERYSQQNPVARREVTSEIG
jgi:hypothetical protein